jgi:hypothetical protein
MSTTKPITAPPLTWKGPRDSNSTNQYPGEAQRNIRYGWLSAIGSKDKQEVCRSRSTLTKMRSLSNSPSTPSFLRQPAAPVEPPVMPPSSKEPVPQAQPQSLLNEDLIERTRHMVVYISLTLKEIGCGSEEWNCIAKLYWGVTDESAQSADGPATVAGASTAVGELVQILLVEGALLFGRAEFEKMDRVRKLVEACMIVQKGLQQIQESTTV